MPATSISTAPYLSEVNDTYRRQITIPQPENSSLASLSADCGSPFHVDNNYQFHASIRKPAVHGNALIESMQKSEVVANGFRWHTGFEDVQA